MRIFIRACTLPRSTDTTSKPSNDGGQPSPNALNSSSVRGRLSIPLIIFDGRSVIRPTLSQLAPVYSTSLFLPANMDLHRSAATVNSLTAPSSSAPQ